MSNPEDEIRVDDRRKFDDKGNLKETGAKKDTSPKGKKIKPEPEQATEKKTEDKKDTKKTREDFTEDYKKGKIDFLQFILSLYTTAMIQLGEITDPVSNSKNENHEQAKEIIDIIIMLQEKTRGNLTRDEENVLDELVFQARMIYLKHVGGLKV